jgi:hypothetical protein
LACPFCFSLQQRAKFVLLIRPNYRIVEQQYTILEKADQFYHLRVIRQSGILDAPAVKIIFRYRGLPIAPRSFDNFDRLNKIFLHRSGDIGVPSDYPPGRSEESRQEPRGYP